MLTVKRLLDVLKSAAADLDETHPDTAHACWEVINTLVEMGAEPAYFPDAIITITDTTEIH